MSGIAAAAIAESAAASVVFRIRIRYARRITPTKPSVRKGYVTERGGGGGGPERSCCTTLNWAPPVRSSASLPLSPSHELEA